MIAQVVGNFDCTDLCFHEDDHAVEFLCFDHPCQGFEFEFWIDDEEALFDVVAGSLFRRDRDDFRILEVFIRDLSNGLGHRR